MKNALLLALLLASGRAAFGGSFFVNLTVIDSSRDPVFQSVRDLNLDAFVVTDKERPNTYVICEKQSDNQDLEYGIALSKKLSLSTGSPVLYTLMHDSDVLILVLVKAGLEVFNYNSWPGYFDGAEQIPAINKLENLCSQFKISYPTALKLFSLKEKDGKYLFADALLLDILRLLQLPQYIEGAGYNYVLADSSLFNDYGATVETP